MRLSVVFELLLVFLFLAFAAARVLDPKSTTKNAIKGTKKQTIVRQGPPNRYCACTSKMCNCCRDFSLPVVPVKGPGCASILYVQKNTMLVTMSFGDRVLSNTTISGKNPRPICMPLPGGISQFCGRVYGISRKGEQFRACLGLELRALDDIEAALRVSCFKFGPKGVNLEAAPPVPTGTSNKNPEDDDEEDDDDDYLDDDDDDIIGFGVDEEEGSSEDNEVDSDSVDYTGFSVLGEDILGSFFDSGSSSVKKKKVKKTAKPQTILQKAPKTTTTTTTTRRPLLQTRWRPSIPSFVTRRPLIRRPTTTTTTTTTYISSSKPTTLAINTGTESEINGTGGSIQVTSFLINNKESSNVAHETPPVPTKHIFITSEAPITHSFENEATIFEDVDSVKTEMTPPVTFTVPTKKIEILKNDIKIPQMDLTKIEALAAIAQQDVTSGVISTSSLTLDDAEKPSEEMVTTKYENIVPTFISHIVEKNSQPTEKINFVQFVPSVIVTPTLNTNLSKETVLSKRNVSNTNPTNLVTLISSSKNKVTNNIKTTINPIYEKENEDEDNENENLENKDEDASDDIEEESNEDEKNSEEKQDKEQKITNNKKLIIINKVAHKTKNNNKGSLKKQSNKEGNKESEEDEEKEEEEEDEDDDLLSGVLDDDDDSEDEHEEEQEQGSLEEVTESFISIKPPKGNKKEKEDDESEEEEEEEAEDDDLDDDEIAEILGETKINSNKKKPTMVIIKKKPLIGNKKKDDEDDEDDILATLNDDDTNDDDDNDDDDVDEDDDDDDDENEDKTEQNTNTNPLKISTVKVKIPSQPVTQSFLTKQPTTQKTAYSSSNNWSNTQKINHATKTKLKPSNQPFTQSVVQKPINQQIVHTFQRIPVNQHKIESTEIRNSTNYITQIFKTKPTEIQSNVQGVIWKTPIPQEIFQNIITKKPIETTEKIQDSTGAKDKYIQVVPEKLETIEKTTEKVFIYKPITQKVFLYSRPENKVSQKVSGITFYQEPVTQKYVIYNEPIETNKTTEIPVTFIYPPQKSNATVEEEHNENKEENENDSSSSSSSSSSEEQSDGENSTLMASIVQDNPGFSNKYGEEHDLEENEDLGIEESDDEDRKMDDRKLKQISKIAVIKSASNKKSSGVFSDPKWVRLSGAASQSKKLFNQPKDNKPISTSRTHRRMNLDRFLSN